MRPVAKSFTEHAELVRVLLTRDENAAFRGFLDAHDDLTRRQPDQLAAFTADRPNLTGSPYDAALAGLVEHHLLAHDLHVPAWVDEPQRFAVVEWFVDDTRYARMHDRAHTPPAFLRHGVIIAATELDSV